MLWPVHALLCILDAHLILKKFFRGGGRKKSATHARSAGLYKPWVYFYLFSTAAVVFIPSYHYSQW